MQRNKNITPRALSYQEKADREKGIYDSFANYLCCCGKCNYLDKSNMYLMRAESRVKKLNAEGVKCPGGSLLQQYTQRAVPRVVLPAQPVKEAQLCFLYGFRPPSILIQSKCSCAPRALICQDSWTAVY